MSRTKGAKDNQPRKKTGSSAKPKKQNDKAVKQPPIPKKKADNTPKKKTGAIVAGVKKNKGSKVIADLKLGARKNVQS